MVDLSKYDPSCVSNPNNNLFGLPTTEDDAKLVILPVPWEVTVSYTAGTARAPETILNASYHMDIYDADMPDAWKEGYYMHPCERKILMRSDYLRKEAELYIDYISKGDDVNDNQFMKKTLREVNEGGDFLNDWVYEQTKTLLNKQKLVGILGGDQSAAFGYIKALAEKENKFGILHIDAHCDLRETYEGFNYSHMSVMHNVLTQIPQVEKLVQVGPRDCSQAEWNYIQNSNGRIETYFDRTIKERQFSGEAWKSIVDEIVSKLPQKVYISFDIDGLDAKLCPHTGSPVPGGFEIEDVFYLFKSIWKSGRTIIGFDLSEIGIGDTDWNANVGAHALLKLCNLLVSSN